MTVCECSTLLASVCSILQAVCSGTSHTNSTGQDATARTHVQPRCARAGGGLHAEWPWLQRGAAASVPHRSRHDSCDRRRMDGRTCSRHAGPWHAANDDVVLQVQRDARTTSAARTDDGVFRTAASPSGAAAASWYLYFAPHLSRRTHRVRVAGVAWNPTT